jgi:regulator of replication initiation timing
MNLYKVVDNMLKEIKCLRSENVKIKENLASQKVKTSEAITANTRLIDSKHSLLLEHEELQTILNQER